MTLFEGLPGSRFASLVKEFDESECPELAIEIYQLVSIILRPFIKCQTECTLYV
jgi:hypothetical protein